MAWKQKHEGVRYVVINENMLGYITDDDPTWAGVLQGKILRGGPDWKNGPVCVSPSDAVREATPEDFDDYRISSTGYFVFD